MASSRGRGGVAAGASVEAVQRMLGHANVYAGLFDDEVDDVAEGMGAAAESARTADQLRTGPAPDGKAAGDESR